MLLKTKEHLSNEFDPMRVGKSGEYFVLSDLLLQGFDAFLSDQGLSYDIVVCVGDELKRLQVKSTQKLNNLSLYTFSLRQQRRNDKNKRRNIDETDFVAFVALDRKKVAYMGARELLARKKENVFQLQIAFKTKEFHMNTYNDRGKLVENRGKFIEDYMNFKEMLVRNGY